ncbi:MAG: cardiolipin synthase [Oscillospiraceae bacterium]|nr:cardiolipin synthase [Oscillospiraceae bacterium]
MRAFAALFSFLFKRAFFVGVILVAQICLLAFFIVFASQEIFYAYILFYLISIVVVIFIVSNNENPSFKITWIIAIMLLPLLGGFFYLLFGNKRLSKRILKITNQSLQQTRDQMPQNTLEETLWAQSPNLALQCRYVYNMSGYPVWEDHFSQYFSAGEQMFAQMLAELDKAERYIFLEYFILAPGQMWDELFAVLEQKARTGVEVRLMYDDVGTINRLPRGFDKAIRKAGVKLCVFNPFRPHLSSILNHRDHRKLCVIDGKAAFCGGINIADEYINHKEIYGHWKDTGVLIKGPAVWGFVFMYLQQWQFATGEAVDFSRYKAEDHTGLPAAGGYLQVFGDSPLDRVNVTQTAYHNILSRATRYVYITTPYLVLDYETESILCAAAQSGIDVRIITPCRYDKWYVHILTRAHYARIIRAGVRVYEYSPGFMHGKSYVSDDKVCMIGTCNMDFRSFFLHFECSAAFYESATVGQVRDDFLDCLRVSREITLEESLKVSPGGRVLRSILKVFAPLF